MKFISPMLFLATAVSASVVSRRGFSPGDFRCPVKRHYCGIPMSTDLLPRHNGQPPCPAVQMIWVPSAGAASGVFSSGRSGEKNIDDIGGLIADKIGSAVGFDNMMLYGVTWSGASIDERIAAGWLQVSVDKVAKTCPDTKIVLGGMEEGAALVHAAAEMTGQVDHWEPKVYSKVKAIVLVKDTHLNGLGPSVIGYKTQWVCVRGNQKDYAVTEGVGFVPCEWDLESHADKCAAFALKQMGYPTYQ